jgi:hypothetical protein
MQQAGEAGFQLELGQETLGAGCAVEGIGCSGSVRGIEFEEQLQALHHELGWGHASMDREEFQARTLLEAEVELHVEKATVPVQRAQANSSNVRAVTLRDRIGRSDCGVPRKTIMRRNGEGLNLCRITRQAAAAAETKSMGGCERWHRRWQRLWR